MINIGEWNDLQIKREKDFGVYLGCSDSDTEVLLPKKQVPGKSKIGDIMHVFIYRDSDDRLIATVNVPYITLGKLAVLRCVGTTKIGAFMDWGLEKDVFLPFKEQTGAVAENREYLVRMYKDKSDRLCVSMKVYDYLKTESPYKQGDDVEGIVIEYNSKLGAFVAVDNKYSALIPQKEIHSGLYVGDVVKGRVAEVRDDGKLNLTLQKPIKQQIQENVSMVRDIIESYGGTLPFNDKADAKVIEKEFGISKRAFKTAVGKLLKDGWIRITENEIVLLTEEERAARKNGDVSKEDCVRRLEKKSTPKASSKERRTYDDRSWTPIRPAERKGTVKFTRASGGRRNNRRAMLAELDNLDEAETPKSDNE